MRYGDCQDGEAPKDSNHTTLAKRCDQRGNNRSEPGIARRHHRSDDAAALVMRHNQLGLTRRPAGVSESRVRLECRFAPIQSRHGQRDGSHFDHQR